MMGKRFAAVLFALCLVAFTVQAGAEYKIKMGYSPGNLPPEDSMEIMYGHIFKKVVEEKSGGRIEVEIYQSDALGSAGDTVGAISANSVEMGQYEIALWAPYNRNTMIFSLPGMLRDKDETVAMFNSDWAYENVFNELELKANFKILGGLCKGFRDFTTKGRPLKTPADIKGLSIRVMDSPMYVKMIEALSANPIILAGSEMYTAMKNGVVDGHENAVLSIWQDKTYEVQDNLILDEHVPGILTFVISAKFYNGLPADLRKAVDEANKAAMAESHKVVLRIESELTKRLAESGMTVYVPTPEEKKLWHDTIRPPCEAFLRTRIDSKLVDGYVAELGKHRTGKP
ncbi:MAG: TRAP transporter substrate-binding protein [Planctomycetota bacterium]|jgi:C4-dicarboxylate-binding protein DctP|nr:TRAP transporter substrate-binding protein [Planctomycetota bacterium]